MYVEGDNFVLGVVTGFTPKRGVAGTIDEFYHE